MSASLSLLASTFVPILFAARKKQPQADLGQMAAWLIGAVVVIALISLVIHFVNRWVHRRRYNCHATVFSGLCDAHQLSSRQGKLLQQIARQNNFARQPARVFVEAKWLDPTHSKQSGISPKELAVLQNRLFR